MAKQRSSFRDKVSANTEKQKRDASGYGYLMLPDGVKTFSPEPDQRVKFDILLYEVTDEKHMDRDDKLEIATVGSQWYKHPFKTHRNIGAGEGDTVVCLSTIGKKCPICEDRAKRIRDGADKEETDALKPSSRNLYIIVPRDSKKHDVEPHIFDISQAMFQKKLNQEMDENDDYKAFPDPEEGYTLRVRFESRTIGKSKPFAEAGRIDFEQRKDSIEKEFMDHGIELDKILKILSYDELEKKYFELDDEEPVEEKEVHGKHKDDDEPPARSRKPVEKEKEPEVELPTWEELSEMSLRKLARICKDQELKVDPEDFPDDDDLLKFAEAIADELGIDIPKKKETAKPSRSVSGGKDKCPHGHKFGIDTDKFPDCKKCKVWDNCADEKDSKK
jgi:hypothetical protein